MNTEEPTAVKKIERMFRQHADAPADVVSPLYRQLTQEWADLHALTSTAATVRRWSRTEPALAGLRTPGDVVDAVDAAPHARKDELLLALIRLFQAGQQLAGRTVLQALLPKLAKTSASATLCTSSTDSWAEDRRHITLAEFWDVMADYPVARRTTSVASNLALDTLHRVSGVRRPTPDVPVDPHDFLTVDDMKSERFLGGVARRTWLAGVTSEDYHSVGEELTADADLLQVITWALRRGVLTRDEAHLLVTTYTPTRAAGCGFADTAARLGASQAAVRQRCSRAARKLADAVRAEVFNGVDTPARLAVKVA